MLFKTNFIVCIHHHNRVFDLGQESPHKWRQQMKCLSQRTLHWTGTGAPGHHHDDINDQLDHENEHNDDDQDDDHDNAPHDDGKC